MRQTLWGGMIALAGLALSPSISGAQATGTPIFKAPYRAFTSHEFGASLSDPGSATSIAIEGFYRYGYGVHDFSLRGGFADPEGEGDVRILLGGDFRTQVLSYSQTIPLDGSLTVGLGTNIGDGDDVWYIPVGVSLGRRFVVEGSNMTFVPYAHPVLLPILGSEEDDLGFTLGLGVDIKFTRDLAARVSGGIGDLEGVGITLAYVR